MASWWASLKTFCFAFNSFLSFGSNFFFPLFGPLVINFPFFSRVSWYSFSAGFAAPTWKQYSIVRVKECIGLAPHPNHSSFSTSKESTLSFLICVGVALQSEQHRVHPFPVMVFLDLPSTIDLTGSNVNGRPGYSSL